MQRVRQRAPLASRREADTLLRMDFTDVIPAALFSLYIGVSNIAFSERISEAYRRWGVDEWLAEPSDCRVAGIVAVTFGVGLFCVPLLN